MRPLPRRSAASLLTQIQLSLECLYRLDPAPQISDFLLEGPSPHREQLLIEQTQDSDLFLGLRLDPAVPLKLEAPCLAHDNLVEFCLAVEGVSHFLFVIFCARQLRRVSALELELQAEVDKFVACVILANRSPSLPTEQIRGRLFDAFHLSEGLDLVEQHRYSRANALARQYSRALERRFIHRLQIAAMVIELRLFYRMGCERKLEFIAGR
jgi:hypothetical protein